MGRFWVLRGLVPAEAPQICRAREKRRHRGQFPTQGKEGGEAGGQRELFGDLKLKKGIKRQQKGGQAAGGHGTGARGHGAERPAQGESSGRGSRHLHPLQTPKGQRWLWRCPRVRLGSGSVLWRVFFGLRSPAINAAATGRAGHETPAAELEPFSFLFFPFAARGP